MPHRSSIEPVLPVPKALIVTHAGYIYPGIVAAAAYNLIGSSLVSRVVLLGPSHKVPLKSIDLSSAAYFMTPLGYVATNKVCVDALLELPCVELNDQTNVHDHSLEVQIPFLQRVLGRFNILPVIVQRRAPLTVFFVVIVCTAACWVACIIIAK